MIALPIMIGLSLLPSRFSHSTSRHTDTTPATNIIVSLNVPVLPSNVTQLVNTLNLHLDEKLVLLRPMSGQSLLVASRSTNVNQERILEQLGTIPIVEEASRDAPLLLTSVDDPQFEEQWQLHSPDTFKASLNVVEAWDITHGSADVVVAVVDTGIDYSHPELTGRILPGYDFVSALSNSVDSGIEVPDELEFLRSHDGDGRDSDASDPGDAIDETLRSQFDTLDIECYVGNSSWHGTAMASIIAANVNDGSGIAGIDWHAKILPVRAIGKCGGHRSDMLDAIRWAAGVDDPFLPPNPTPARIINLSLGVDDLCTTADQRAIDDAIAAGALVVAAVGNNGRNTDAQPSSPSHCQNVIGVMAVDRFGFRASYSNFGRDADVAAPGGDISTNSHNILVATNKGTAEPATSFGLRPATGTSVAAPHVAGVLALMLSVKPELTNRELEALLLDSARDFPANDNTEDSNEFVCEKSYCGAGILDALTAVQAVDGHFPGTFLDSPALAAAQSVPVTVGGFGCTVSKRQTQDPMLLILFGLGTITLYVRRRIALIVRQKQREA